MTTPTDPKARVVEIVDAALHEGGLYNLIGSSGIRLESTRVADRLASAGRLASAPVVPSAQELAEVLIEAKRIEEGFEKVAEIPKLPPEHPQMKRAQAIRNHLLTLGWREK